jgi:hypothetical protein
MLRRISTLVAAVAMIGTCAFALPALASPSGAHAAHATAHKFNAPTIKKHNVVSGWGTYTRVNSARVVVHVCVRQTGSAFAVGTIAVASKANGSSKKIAAVVIAGKKGSTACGYRSFVFYTAHLKVYTFVGKGGRIIATSAAKKIY